MERLHGEQVVLHGDQPEGGRLVGGLGGDPVVAVLLRVSQLDDRDVALDQGTQHDPLTGVGGDRTVEDGVGRRADGLQLVAIHLDLRSVERLDDPVAGVVVVAANDPLPVERGHLDELLGVRRLGVRLGFVADDEDRGQLVAATRLLGRERQTGVVGIELGDDVADLERDRVDAEDARDVVVTQGRDVVVRQIVRDVQVDRENRGLVDLRGQVHDLAVDERHRVDLDVPLRDRDQAAHVDPVVPGERPANRDEVERTRQPIDPLEDQPQSHERLLLARVEAHPGHDRHALMPRRPDDPPRHDVLLATVRLVRALELVLAEAENLHHPDPEARLGEVLQIIRLDLEPEAVAEHHLEQLDIQSGKRDHGRDQSFRLLQVFPSSLEIVYVSIPTTDGVD